VKVALASSAGCGGARGGHRLFQLAEVGLRLDDENVGAAVGERSRLLAVRAEGLGRIDPAVRLEPDPERTDRAADELGLRFARPGDPGRADRRDPVGQAVALEPISVRPERVREDELRARDNERGVDRRDSVGFLLVQRLHAGVQGDAGVDQRRPHPAVGDQRRVRARSQRRSVHLSSAEPSRVGLDPDIVRQRNDRRDRRRDRAILAFRDVDGSLGLVLIDCSRDDPFDVDRAERPRWVVVLRRHDDGLETAEILTLFLQDDDHVVGRAGGK
jgi:hypothetical protein